MIRDRADVVELRECCGTDEQMHVVLDAILAVVVIKTTGERQRMAWAQDKAQGKRSLRPDKKLFSSLCA